LAFGSVAHYEVMYYDPPYFLILAAFASCLAFGSAFSGVLGQFFQSRERDPQPLIAPYLGIVASAILLVGAGLQVFGIFGVTGYIVAVFFVGLLAGIVWYNLLREYT